jgi:hypothetical protein
VDKHLSNAQIDRLGDRLRREDFGEAELRLLDEYRRTFGSAYDRVVEGIQRVTGLPVSGRPAKSTTSIVEKLKRESIRLSQMQDIAGCRAIVSDMAEQDRTVRAIAAIFGDVTIKYGGGSESVRVMLDRTSSTLEDMETLEVEVSGRVAEINALALRLRGMREDYVNNLQSFIKGLRLFE